MELKIPHKFTPRDYQLPFFKAIDSGINRAILIWPRRHGKDKSCINALCKKMLSRVGVYYYVFPEYNQGRKALWDNIDKDGFKTMDHIPKELRKRTDNTQMLIELKNGSIVQCIGASEIDRIVGTNPVGIILSEYSLMSPNVIGFLLPILAENGGFLWANFTPRGDNHAKTFYLNSISNPEYFVQKLTAEECGVFSKEQLEAIKKEYVGMYGDEALFNQEFMTSFEAPVMGSYYGTHMLKAEEEGRVGNVPYEPTLLVNTHWDLGVGDAMAIWFTQRFGKEVRLIDYYENSGEGLSHYIKVLQDRGYTYGKHYAPHDIKVRELTTGKSRYETARSLGINFSITPNLPIDDGIDAVRNLFPRLWFDRAKTEVGRNAVKEYHKEFDEKRKVYKNTPYHDWSSNAADALRYMAINEREQIDLGEFPTDDLPSFI